MNGNSSKAYFYTLARGIQIKNAQKGLRVDTQRFGM
jgi:hypothetical protein